MLACLVSSQQADGEQPPKKKVWGVAASPNNASTSEARTPARPGAAAFRKGGFFRGAALSSGGEGESGDGLAGGRSYASGNAHGSDSEDSAIIDAASDRADDHDEDGFDGFDAPQQRPSASTGAGGGRAGKPSSTEGSPSRDLFGSPQSQTLSHARSDGVTAGGSDTRDRDLWSDEEDDFLAQPSLQEQPSAASVRGEPSGKGSPSSVKWGKKAAAPAPVRLRHRRLHPARLLSRRATCRFAIDLRLYVSSERQACCFHTINSNTSRLSPDPSGIRAHRKPTL